MTESLMMPTKLAVAGLLETKVLQNKTYGVIIFFRDVTNYFTTWP